MDYWLSSKMKRYIISNDDSYMIGRGGLIVNRTIAKTKTTREGNTRADASDYISPDLPQDYNIGELKMEELESIRIRKLTPKECFRLMGFAEIKGSQDFDDSNFEKASSVVSNSQLYKQAGNSIVVDVLEAIFKEMC